MTSYYISNEERNAYLHDIVTGPCYQRDTGDPPLTEEEWEDMMVKWKCMDDEKKQAFNQKCREYKKRTGNLKTQLCNVHFDQKATKEEVIDAQMKLIEGIKSAEWALIDHGKARCEYYSEVGWNPHIHIFTYQIKNDGALAQHVRKKIKTVLKEKASIVYRVSVVNANDDRHVKYINGEKKEGKEKYVRMDENFRKENGIEETYEL